MLLYVGTYTEADSQGIEIYRMNEQTGTLSFRKTVPQIKNPSYIKLSPDQKYLYAVNELLKWDGKPQGAVAAFSVDWQNGDLHLINQVPSEGRAPCYITMPQNGRFVLVTNYLDGIVLSLAVLKNGGVGEPVTMIPFSGSGFNKTRQNASHVHSINLDPQNTFAVIADLGTDKLTMLSFNLKSGQLKVLKDQSAQTAPGAGPRHLTFSANGKYVYVANELNNTVEAFSIDSAYGSLHHFQTIRTIPDDYKGSNYPADIHLSPNGRFLYVSNRGHESLAVFAVRKHNGKLKRLATSSVYGSRPRNFILSKDGQYLLAANQKSKNIVTFRCDAHSGLLKKQASVNTIASPACLQIGIW